jgi:hypothetical protein
LRGRQACRAPRLPWQALISELFELAAIVITLDLFKRAQMAALVR